MAVLTIPQLIEKFGPGDAPRSNDYIDLIDTLADDRNAVYFDTTEPTDTDANPLWFNTSTNELSIYSGGQWNSIQGSGGSSTNISATSPLSYNSETGELSIDLSSYDTSAEVDTKLLGYDQSSAVDTKISTAIANLVDTAPTTLDTLNELAAALGNDPNFATTITGQIAGKANISHTHAISDITNLQTELDNKANLSGATFTGQLIVNTSGEQHQISIYQENDTDPIADTFSGTTDKSYIHFTQTSGSDDPGYIMHETQTTPDTNEGVLHLVPTDDNSVNDYVSIHGTNDTDALRLHTSGLVESAGATELSLASGSGTINAQSPINLPTTDVGISRARNIMISTSSPSGGNIGDIWIQY